MRQLIKIDGSTTELPEPVNMTRATALIGADAIDVVQLRHMGQPTHVMLVDDTGLCDGRPVNAAATKLYHANCRPGVTHPICGDVIVAPDADWA